MRICDEMHDDVQQHISYWTQLVSGASLLADGCRCKQLVLPFVILWCAVITLSATQQQQRQVAETIDAALHAIPQLVMSHNCRHDITAECAIC
jgi:hypothetical protein